MALGFVLSRTLKSATLIILLKRHIDFFPFKETTLFMLKALATGAVSAAVCQLSAMGFEHFTAGAETRLLLSAKLVLCAGCAAIGFVASVLLFRLQEPVTMLQWTIERFSRSVGSRDT